MAKLTVIIADDERPAREYLKSLLRGFPDVELIGEAENGSDAVALIKDRKPDLALFDLQMPEMSGIEAVRSLRRSQMPLIAFVTAFDDHAIQAFELNAVDYLLKPVEKQRLAETLSRAVERLEHSDWREAAAERVENAADTYDEAASSSPLRRIPVRSRDDIVLVPVDDVASIVADAELLHITTYKNKRYVINYRLKDLERRLDERKFVRLSRGAIVNLDMVSKVSHMPGGTYLVTLNNGEEISSSRLQSRLLRAKLFKL
jgi:DNA-binding LytR/AlgR family response regulator